MQRYFIALLLSVFLVTHCSDKYVKDEWNSYEDYSYLDEEDNRLYIDAEIRVSYVDISELNEDTQTLVQDWFTEAFLKQTYHDALKSTLSALIAKNSLKVTIEDTPDEANLLLTSKAILGMHIKHLDYHLSYRESMMLKEKKTAKTFLSRNLSSSTHLLNNQDLKTLVNEMLKKIAFENAQYILNQLNV